MTLRIENRGSGSFGELGSGWRVTLNDMPSVVGSGGGRLGSINMSARCTPTTKFTIDNYLSIRHYFDDQTTRWLSAFDGYIRSVDVNGEFASIGVNSILSALDVERVASTDAAGTYQRAFELPAMQPYTISSTTYYTGGYYTSVGSENIFVRQDILIYDVVARDDFVYILASGGHAGEVVFRFYADGRFLSVWPVYSDATDLASPNSTVLSVWSGGIAVGQQQAKRVKLFSRDGVFSLQFGAAGSADGQFQTVSGVAVSETFSSIFVTDSVLGRVQRFSKAGVYQNKWGTSGTGSGTSVFNAPNRVSIDPITEHVFVSDNNARVRVYDSFGNYQAQPMGSYDFSMSRSSGEYITGTLIGTAFDHRGNAYGMQQGRIYRYGRTTTQTASRWFYGSAMIKNWDAIELGTATYVAAIGGDEVTGQLYVARDRNIVEQYAGCPGSLVAFLNYYIGLAVHDFPTQYLVLNQPDGLGPYPFIGWEGNVWENICDLCASTENAAAVFDERLSFFNREDRTFHLPPDAEISPVQLSSRSNGQTVRVVNQNARWTDSVELVYDSIADDRRVFGTDVNGLAYTVVDPGVHLDYVVQPVAGSTAAPGTYTVIDRNNLAVSATDWNNYGGRIHAEVGEDPGTIRLTIFGPGLEIPGTEAPYRIADVGGVPTLSLLGSGIVTSPEVLDIGTGVSESVASQLVARNIESPFLHNAAVAYTEGSWAAYNAGTPNQSISIRFRADRSFGWIDDSTGLGGTFQFINTYVLHDDSEYLIQHVSYDRAWITLEGIRANRAGHTSARGEPNTRFEEIWNNVTTAAFESYWVGYTAQDLAIAPLRNPYGYNYSSTD